MAIIVKELQRHYWYSGIALPAPPGMSDLQVRDLHSLLYPELITADICVAAAGPDGVVDVTFRKAVGTKGGDLRRFRQSLDTLPGPDARRAGACRLTTPQAAACATVLLAFVDHCSPCQGDDRRDARVLLPSPWLAPVP
ncbi:PRTRC system protein C [Janthinobacterium sp. PSPC3-1]|uniref:PRTRC system protein C n=1 Tax=Janthinobacterium sp. PSPC3-1 TaxID=2804653 RepID=UPI003CFBB2A8